MFRFIVVNDLHHAGPGCTPFMEALVHHMRERPPFDFALVLGDLSDVGDPNSLEAVRKTLSGLRVPAYPVPGNHDCDLEGNTRLYQTVFPGRLNYRFDHANWQFVGFDSTDGAAWENTRIRPEVLDYLKATAAELDPSRATVLFTHFPLGENVRFRTLDADAVLQRIDCLKNIRCIFSGHFHGRTERTHRGIPLVTNACCSRVQDNHDGTTVKGYLLCTAHPDGRLEREFVTFSFAG